MGTIKHIKRRRKMKQIIFSLGGSIIVPNKIDYHFLKKFKTFIAKLAKKHKIAIICGGGKTARDYIKALEKEKATIHERNTVGIECTRLNALVLATFLGKLANQKVPLTTKEFLKMRKRYKVVVTGGGLEKHHVGTTSDGTTAYITAKLRAKQFINLTNVNGVYNKNPIIHRNAKRLRKLSYKKLYQRIKNIKEKPGQHFILDKYATQVITKHKIKVAVMNGRNIKNIENFLKGRKFVGSIIG